MKLLVLFKAYVLLWTLMQVFCLCVFLSFTFGKCFSLFFVYLFLHQTVVQIFTFGHQHLFCFFFPTLNCQNSVDGELKNTGSTSLASSALLSHELLPLSLEVELLKLLRNACEIRVLSAICAGAWEMLLKRVLLWTEGKMWKALLLYHISALDD